MRDASGKFTPGTPKQENSGRVAGVANVVTRDIREMIHTALTKTGGVNYLVRQSNENPVAFMGLVGKIIPQQIDATIRRELPMMTREDILALLDKVRAIAQPARVIEHEAAPQQVRDKVKKPK